MSRNVKNRARRLQNASKRPQDAPTWCPRRPKSRPRGAQDASRTAQELPKRHSGSGPQGARSQMTPKSGPRAAQKLPRPPPDLDFGPFWQRFDQDLRKFVIVFGRLWEGGFGMKWDQKLKQIGSLFSQLSACSAGGGCAPPDPPLLRGMKIGSMFS